MKKLGHFLLLSCLALFLFGCGKKDDPNTKGNQVLTFEEGQVFDFEFEADATSEQIKFSAKEIWMVQKETEDGADDSWYELSPEYGQPEDDVTVVLSVKENTSEGTADRVGVFKLLCGDSQQTFVVQQYARNSQSSNYVYLKDENFRNYCLANFDTNSDGKLSKEEALAVTEISCANLDIKSLDGIQYFKSLEVLNCRYNSIEGELNLSGLTTLKELTADHNLYSKLDVSDCSALVSLVANDNYSDAQSSLEFSLKEVNLKGCTALKYIKLQDNALESLDLSDCAELEELDASYNELTQINLTNCKKLRLASVRTNHLNSVLDLSNCSELTYLGAWEAELTGLNVDGCTKLVQLIAYRNPNLKTVSLDACTALTELNLYETGITEIDVHNNPELVKLNLGYTGGLSSIDLSNNTKVVELNLQENKLAALDVSPCKNLTVLKAEDNELTSINLKGCTELSQLYLYNNQLESVDLSTNTKLGSIAIQENLLTSLDVTACASSLYFLDCKTNNIAELKFGAMPLLNTLDATHNHITSLDLRSCPELAEVLLGNNELTDLKVRGLNKMTVCEFQNNKLTRLDLRGCTAIDELHIPNNQLAYVSFRECTALRYVDCRQNKMTTLDFSNNSNMAFLFAGTNPQLHTIYVQEGSSYSTLDCDETATVYQKAPSEYDVVGGGDNWGDEDVNPWN